MANSIGPFATVYGIYRDGGVSKNAAVPIWILVVGMLDCLVAFHVGLKCWLLLYWQLKMHATLVEK